MIAHDRVIYNLVETKDRLVVDEFTVFNIVALLYPPLDVYVQLVDHLGDEARVLRHVSTKTSPVDLEGFDPLHPFCGKDTPLAENDLDEATFR